MRAARRDDAWRLLRGLLAWAGALCLLADVPAPLPVAGVLIGLLIAALRQGLARPPRSEDLRPEQLSGIRAAQRRMDNPGMTYLGRGGRWSVQHSLALHRSADPSRALDQAPARCRSAPPLRVADALLQRNILALGAPGSGKSSLLALLAWQAQRRGEALVILDPKGSRMLRRQLLAGARAAGRPFLGLVPAQPQRSARYDPLGQCRSAGAVADRLAALVAGKRDDPFRMFCHGVVATLCEALLVRGEVPSLARLRSLVEDAGAALLSCDPPAQLGVDPRRADAAQAALQVLATHDRTHYRKMVAGLLPVLQVLTTSGAALVLNGEAAVPPPLTGPMPADQPPLLDLPRCRAQGATVYVALDALAEPRLAQALAHLLLMDLAALASARWSETAPAPRMHLMVDEAGEVACEPLLQLLGKGREADLHVLIAVQTLSDLEWRLGGAAAARVAEGNAGAWFLFRQLDARSREESEARLGTFPMPRESEAQGFAQSVGLAAPRASYTRMSGRTSAEAARVPAAVLAVLRDLECLAHLPDGELLHLRLPVHNVADPVDARCPRPRCDLAAAARPELPAARSLAGADRSRR